jgi:hypothetical protein
MSMTSNDIPDSAVLSESVDRIEHQLVLRIGQHRKRRQRLRITLSLIAGVVLFSGGVAVGGVAFASTAHKAADRSRSALLTVVCHSDSTTNSAASVLQFNVQSVADDVGQDPVATCGTLKSATAENRDVNSGISALRAKGLSCGYIDIQGFSTFYFDGEGVTNDVGELAVEPGCDTSVSITPTPVRADFVACAASSDRADVYPATEPIQSAKILCASHGEKIWRR